MNDNLLITELHSILYSQAIDDAFSGVVSLRRDGKPIFQAAVGDAIRGWQIPNELSTRFRIGSLSKLFTAVAIGQLIDRGLLALDDSVVDLLKLNDTQIAPGVTVFHLLTMTGGIADWFEESGNWEVAWEKLRWQRPLYFLRSNSDYVPLFINKRANFPPGERHQYSNSSYILLARIIERLSRQSFFDYLRHNIFDPLAMHATSYASLDDVVHQLAEGYIPVEDINEQITGWQRNIYLVTPQGAGDGGAISTVDDLSRFLNGLRGGELLSIAMTRQFLTPQVVEDEEKSRGFRWMYAFGLYFLIDDEGQVVRWGATGEEEGVSCRLFHYPHSNTDLIILGNRSWCAGPLGWRIHDLLLGDG